MRLIFIAGQVEVEACLAQVDHKEGSHEYWNYYETPGGIVVHTGMGAINAACAAYTAIQHFQPSSCLQIGLSGAHLARLEIGQVIVGEEVKTFSRHLKLADGSIEALPHLIQKQQRSESYPAFQPQPELLEWVCGVLDHHQVNYEKGVVGSADQFNRDPAFIAQIQEVFGTWCEDMESGAIAQVAMQAQRPYLSIRVISNNELTATDNTLPGQRFSQRSFDQLSKLGAYFLASLPQAPVERG